MRDIKFRGLRTDGKGWAYGDLIHGVGWKKGKIYILPGNIQQEGCHHLDGFEVKPESVGQFTGRLTQFDEEIFQGDKLSHLDNSTNGYWLVKWSELNDGWICYNYISSENEEGNIEWLRCERYPLGHSLSGLLTYKYRIIGNIHENPELAN